ncbi:hypothetical protein J1784_00015, partial [Rahnella sp. FRB 231]|nr:hypothetical protein [Rahnella ecdela]
YQKPEPQRKQDDALQHEVKRLRQELKRVTEERDILKKAAVDSTCQRNTLFKNLFWRLKFQCFPRPVV